MQLTVKQMPEQYDHDLLYVGSMCVGFVGRDSGAHYLQRCPECGRENYAMSVANGVCAWCGFDLNKEAHV